MTNTTLNLKSEPKETVRRFDVTCSIVIDTTNHKKATDTQIKDAVTRLVEHGFTKSDSTIILEASTTNIEEVAL